MGKFEEIAEALDKGDYDNFSDSQLLSFEIMRAFKVSSATSSYVAKMFIHQKNKTCENCRWFQLRKEVSFCDNIESTAYNLEENLKKDDGCNKWEKKQNAE